MHSSYYFKLTCIVLSTFFTHYRGATATQASLLAWWNCCDLVVGSLNVNSGPIVWVKDCCCLRHLRLRELYWGLFAHISPKIQESNIVALQLRTRLQAVISGDNAVLKIDGASKKITCPFNVVDNMLSCKSSSSLEGSVSGMMWCTRMRPLLAIHCPMTYLWHGMEWFAESLMSAESGRWCPECAVKRAYRLKRATWGITLIFEEQCAQRL